MKQKRIYHAARMFSVELSNKSQLLSASSAADVTHSANASFTAHIGALGIEGTVFQ